MNAFDKTEQARRALLFDQAQAALGATKPNLPIPPLKQTGARDMKGTLITVGATVARALSADSGAYIRICKVTGMEAGKVYLDHSKVAVKHPSRLLII